MRDYDDWKLSSGQEDKVYCYCEWCSSEIYIGEQYYRLTDGEKIHEDCFESIARSLLSPKLRTAGE